MSPPMTMDERVEAAARAYDPDAFAETASEALRRATRQHVREILAAAFPELHGDQPKGWIAPWDPTDKMCLATTAGAADEVSDALRWDVEHEWKSLRDAYLGKGDGG